MVDCATPKALMSASLVVQQSLFSFLCYYTTTVTILLVFGQELILTMLLTAGEFGEPGDRCTVTNAIIYPIPIRFPLIGFILTNCFLALWSLFVVFRFESKKNLFLFNNFPVSCALDPRAN